MQIWLVLPFFVQLYRLWLTQHESHNLHWYTSTTVFQHFKQSQRWNISKMQSNNNSIGKCFHKKRIENAFKAFNIVSLLTLVRRYRRLAHRTMQAVINLAHFHLISRDDPFFKVLFKCCTWKWNIFKRKSVAMLRFSWRKIGRLIQLNTVCFGYEWRWQYSIWLENEKDTSKNAV